MWQGNTMNHRPLIIFDINILSNISHKLGCDFHKKHVKWFNMGISETIYEYTPPSNKNPKHKIF